MKKVGGTKKYFLYARKSTESEDRQVLSIESQINELKGIAAKEGLQIVGVLQESRSAKELGRPVFAELMEKIQRGEADGILCWKLDRLARNFIDGGRIIEAVQRGIITHIRSFERNYYPEDNVLLMAVELGMAPPSRHWRTRCASPRKGPTQAPFSAFVVGALCAIDWSHNDARHLGDKRPAIDTATKGGVDGAQAERL
jgi:site-specific DNA recombinase